MNNSEIDEASFDSGRNTKRPMDATSSGEGGGIPLRIPFGGFCNPQSHNVANNNKRQASDTDVLMAQEMNALTTEEREAVYEDIHGVSKVVNETEDMVQKSMENLERELANVRGKVAYDKAVFLSPKYVKNLRLMFLRAKQFQEKQAAELMIQYFEKKLELFGPEKLVKVLTMDDLDDDDKEALMTGTVQYLPQKDRGGRLIFFSDPRSRRYRDRRNFLRMYWYYTMRVMMNDEEAQKKGVVVLGYNVETTQGDALLFHMGGQIANSLPIRFAGFHYCLNDTSFYPLVSLLKIVGGVSIRLRFRVHFGSHTECRYELIGYGIPPNILPFQLDGTLDLSGFHAFFAEVRQQECRELNNARESSVIDYPTNLDVLLGRGKPYQLFPGNVRWMELIEALLPRYQAAEMGKKQLISNQVVDHIKLTGGRFLKRSEDGDAWVMASADAARQKNSQIFRFRIRSLNEPKQN